MTATNSSVTPEATVLVVLGGPQSPFITYKSTLRSITCLTLYDARALAEIPPRLYFCRVTFFAVLETIGISVLRSKVTMLRSYHCHLMSDTV